MIFQRFSIHAISISLERRRRKKKSRFSTCCTCSGGILWQRQIFLFLHSTFIMEFFRSMSSFFRWSHEKPLAISLLSAELPACQSRLTRRRRFLCCDMLRAFETYPTKIFMNSGPAQLSATTTTKFNRKNENPFFSALEKREKRRNC